MDSAYSELNKTIEFHGDREYFESHEVDSEHSQLNETIELHGDRECFEDTEFSAGDSVGLFTNKCTRDDNIIY